MNKILYYSPYVPFVGLFTAAYFSYKQKTSCISDSITHYFVSMVVQGIGMGVVVMIIAGK